MEESEKKVVLITGASSGIGEACALEFARLGHRVAITGRDEARLEATSARMLAAAPAGARHHDYLALQVDFEDEQQVDSVVARVAHKFQRLDVLVNNAGYAGAQYEITDERFYADFQKVLQVNLMAATRLAQLAVPLLERHSARRPGVIINVGSIADRVAYKKLAYCVSKAGLSMLTKSLANSLEGRPVRVLTVAPGPVRTRIMPEPRFIEQFGERATLLGRAGEPHEVASLVAFLASEKAGYVHATTVDIDGGHLSKLGLLAFESVAESLST